MAKRHSIMDVFPRVGRVATTDDPAWLEADVLQQRITDRSRELAEAGMGAGDRVLISHGNSSEFLCDLLAVWSTGACAICVNPSLTDYELKSIFDFAAPKAHLRVAGARADIVARGGAGRFACVEDPALLLFTSGTTSEPKGVEHSFRSLISRLRINQRQIGAAALSRVLCPLPSYFGHGLIGNLLTPLLYGGDVMIVSDTSPRGLSHLGALIDEHNIRFLSSVPSFWKMLLKISRPPAGGSLQRVHVGSAPMSVELWRRVAAWAGTDNIFNMYGITETANWVCGYSLADGEVSDGKVGKVWGGAAKVRLDDGQTPATGSGEILVRTPSLMTGYFNRPDITAKVVKDGWYATGDTGTIDADGIITLTGRKKSEINRAGMKIQPDEIELLLERHPEIEEACVFGVADEYSGERVAAACVCTSGAPVDKAGIRSWMAEFLCREAIPEIWYMVSEIPKTARGKVNRDTVRAYCEKQELTT